MFEKLISLLTTLEEPESPGKKRNVKPGFTISYRLLSIVIMLALMAGQFAENQKHAYTDQKSDTLLYYMVRIDYYMRTTDDRFKAMEQKLDDQKAFNAETRQVCINSRDEDRKRFEEFRERLIFGNNFKNP